jgi:hypothetical protein
MIPIMEIMAMASALFLFDSLGGGKKKENAITYFTF